ncbi:MAG: hypothetical protein HY298_10495 [Verrucomicrobia bacterium]|nr:hypothetical protein [Verrucomicrobiota bacterium]
MLCSLPLVACAQLTNDIPPLRPPHAEIPPTFWEQHTAGVCIAGLAVLLIAGLVVWLALRPKPPVIVPPEVQARNELAGLRNLTEDGVVLSKVSQAVRRYFAAAFALPPGEFTTAEFCQAITANEQIGSELATSTGDFLRRCDERKFAPSVGGATIGAPARALELVELAEARRAGRKVDS